MTTIVHDLLTVEHPLYTTYNNMKARCLNPNSKSYPNYGGRGITVCEEWLESFKQFAEDMGLPPSPYHTLDREDNNKGYNKDNCRWATRTEQCLNRRIFSNNTSGNTGIVVNKNGTFNVRYDEEHERYNLGNFRTMEEAVTQRTKFIELFETDPDAALQMTEREANLNSTTKIRGISVHPEGFMIRFTLPTKQRIFIGFSPTLEGAIALQSDFTKLYKINPEAAISSIKKKPKSNSSSGVRGITKNGNEFKVRATLKSGQRKYLGSFYSIEAATTALNNFVEHE